MAEKTPANRGGHPQAVHPRRILIIGAGPTGLGAAWRLKELGHDDFQILEANPYAGGLAHSFTDRAGFTWDIGGHVMFSHYDYYDRLFEQVMGDDFVLNNRESWVRLRERWVPYPFQNNIRYLPPADAADCLVGLVRAQACGAPSALDARDFGQFIDRAFGEGIARLFMRPYNFKVWAHPPEMMNKHWIGERVAVIDVERAIRNVVEQRDDFGWGPNNQFKFPKRGGTGEFYHRIAQRLRPHIRLSTRVVHIDPVRKNLTIVHADGTSEALAYDAVISAMPLDVLCTRVVSDAPEDVRRAAGGLLHSSGHMVGIGLQRRCPSTKSWMYFPEDNCPFYRVTYLSNYSPYMTPNQTGANDTHYSLLCETSASPHKPLDAQRIVEDTIAGLENAGLLEPGERRDIVSTWHHAVEYSYPTPSIDRDDRLSVAVPWLERHGIYSRGRFGMWKYEVANTDHTLMQGVEVVDRLLLGEPEHTIGIVYRVTEDGREAASHDRPKVAGSGEKRIARTNTPSV
ncbi:MAG: FAD-dependent oxidoreductase [Phycisphaeraceae bacterium]|nr:FAD-dependent oxidoreductase [Phycisphaeraceae bacterium]